MKIARFYDKDLDHILDVALRFPFKSDVFLERFRDEMHMSHGHKGDLIMNFIATMEALFGPKVSKEMEAKVRADPRWKY